VKDEIKIIYEDQQNAFVSHNKKLRHSREADGVAIFKRGK
jgi:hypothetical protein